MTPLARIASALDGFFYAPATATRLAYLRVLVGAYSLAYLTVWSPSFVSVTRHAPDDFRPVGALSWLSEPIPPSLYLGLFALTLLAGVLATAGLRYRWVGPLYAALVLFVTTYRSSWGMLFHTDNLMTLHLAVLACAPAADAVSLDARSRARATTETEAHGRYGWAVRAIALVTVATYVVAGCAKLRAAGFGWASGHVLATQVAFDNVRKIELGSFHSPLGVFMVAQPALFAPLASFALALELGAPVALLGHRIGRAWAAAAWAFHLGVALTMAIVFAYPLSFVAFAAFVRPDTWRALAFVRRLGEGAPA